MNKLTEFQLDNYNLQNEFSEYQCDFLKDIADKLLKTHTSDLPNTNNTFYNIILLNKIWVDNILHTFHYSQGDEINWDNLSKYADYFEPFELYSWACNCLDMDPKVMREIDESLKCFLKLLLDFRNNPLELLSVINTFKDFFSQKNALSEFHKDLNRIFDLSGLMFNDDLTNENYYLKTNIQIIQLFDIIGFKDIFSGIDLSEKNKPRQFVFQNMSANYFLFMNLLIYMDERIPFLSEQFAENNSLDLKNWQDHFDSWCENVNELVESVSMRPKLNDNVRNCIINTLDETDFGIISAYSGVDFIVYEKDNQYVLGENKESRHTDTKRFINRIDFLNLFTLSGFHDVKADLMKNDYYAIYHSLQTIDGIEPTYKYLLEEMIMVEHDKWLPIYIINNPYMRDNIIISAKKTQIQINYDFKHRLILDSPLIVSENNLHNLEFVKELLKQDFNQYNFLPKEIKQLESIKIIALQEAQKFLSKHVNDKYFSSEEYIETILYFDD